MPVAVSVISRSAQAAANSPSWVTTTTAAPSSAMRRRVAVIESRCLASTPEVGSSRMTMGLPVARAAAITRRCFCPPDRLSGWRSPRLARSKSASSCSPLCPLACEAPIVSSPARVSEKSWRPVSCMTRAQAERRVLREAGTPSMLMLPELGAASPHSTRTRVVLPTPLAPAMQVICPAGKSASSPSKTGLAP